MLDLALLSSLSGVDASGNVVDCGGGFTAGDNTVSLADWFVSTALFPCLSKFAVALVFHGSQAPAGANASCAMRVVFAHVDVGTGILMLPGTGTRPTILGALIWWTTILHRATLCTSPMARAAPTFTAVPVARQAGASLAGIFVCSAERLLVERPCGAACLSLEPGQKLTLMLDSRQLRQRRAPRGPPHHRPGCGPRGIQQHGGVAQLRGRLGAGLHPQEPARGRCHQDRHGLDPSCSGPLVTY